MVVDGETDNEMLNNDNEIGEKKRRRDDQKKRKRKKKKFQNLSHNLPSLSSSQLIPPSKTKVMMVDEMVEMVD